MAWVILLLWVFAMGIWTGYNLSEIRYTKKEIAEIEAATGKLQHYLDSMKYNEEPDGA